LTFKGLKVFGVAGGRRRENCGNINCKAMGEFGAYREKKLSAAVKMS